MSITLENGHTKSRRTGKAEGMYALISMNFHFSLHLVPSQIVGINAETVTHITSTDFPGHWPGEDHSWDLEHFKKVY
jgi:hypothetical protein